MANEDLILGVLKNAKRLADKYHQKILQQSRDAQKIHDNEMADLNSWN